MEKMSNEKLVELELMRIWNVNLDTISTTYETYSEAKQALVSIRTLLDQYQLSRLITDETHALHVQKWYDTMEICWHLKAEEQFLATFKL